MADRHEDGPPRSRTEVIVDAIAAALIEQPHDGSRFTSIHDYAVARLDGSYDLNAVAEYANAQLDEWDANTPLAFERGLLVEAFCGDRDSVARDVSEMFPDEVRRLHDALTLLTTELNKALTENDAELNALLGPEAGEQHHDSN